MAVHLKASVVSGGICFLVGAALNVGAMSLGMLIIGRIMLGVGIGFANHVGLYGFVGSMILKEFLQDILIKARITKALDIWI